MVWFDFMMSNVDVVNRVAALESLRQCETSSARAPDRRRRREARQGFRARLLTCRRIAGGQHHPIGIELELRHLARGQQPIVEFARLIGQSQRKRWLPEPFPSPP
jgi:hypothetical protein